MKMQTNKGIGLVEVLIVAMVLIIISGIVFSSFSKYRRNQVLKNESEVIVSILRDARAKTLASEGGDRYGVHLETDSATLFKGPAYDPNAVTNKETQIDESASISYTGLSGGVADVIFKRLSGGTDVSGTIVISVEGISETKTITIDNTGLIESN